jgi:hypothetical protein
LSLLRLLLASLGQVSLFLESSLSGLFLGSLLFFLGSKSARPFSAGKQLHV